MNVVSIELLNTSKINTKLKPFAWYWYSLKDNDSPDLLRNTHINFLINENGFVKLDEYLNIFHKVLDNKFTCIYITII